MNLQTAFLLEDIACLADEGALSYLEEVKQLPLFPPFVLLGGVA